MEILESRLDVEAFDNPLIALSLRQIHRYLRLLRVEWKVAATLALRTEAALVAHLQSAVQRALGFF